MFSNRLFLLISSLTIPFVVITPSTIAQTIQETPSFFLAQEEEQVIKEEQVEELIKKADQAIQARNIEQILSYFAPFAYSEVTLDTDERAETLKINGLEEHRQYFQDSFAEIKDSEVLFDDYQIKLTGDGSSAYIYRNRLVNYTLNDGDKIIISSKTTARLAPLAGELKIISLEQNSEIDLRPPSQSE